MSRLLVTWRALERVEELRRDGPGAGRAARWHMLCDLLEWVVTQIIRLDRGKDVHDIEPRDPET